MYGCILKPKKDIPLYYCYEIIYDNPKLAKSDIEKYYYKTTTFDFENCESLDNLYELLVNNRNIRIGDIITLNDDDNYYFFSPKFIKIM